MPASRVSAGPRAANAALAAGDAEYDAAMAIPIVPGSASDPVEWFRGIVAGIGRREQHLEWARDLYERDADGEAERSAAHVRVGDLFDSLAAAILAPALPPRTVLHPGGAPSRNDIEEPLGRELQRLAIERYCCALFEYRLALAIDPDDARALDQVAHYGDGFATQCDEARTAGELCH